MGWGRDHQEESVSILIAKDFRGKPLAFYLSELSAHLGITASAVAVCQPSGMDLSSKWGFGGKAASKRSLANLGGAGTYKDITVRGERDDISTESGHSNSQFDGGTLSNTALKCHLPHFPFQSMDSGASLTESEPRLCHFLCDPGMTINLSMSQFSHL